MGSGTGFLFIFYMFDQIYMIVFVILQPSCQFGYGLKYHIPLHKVGVKVQIDEMTGGTYKDMVPPCLRFEFVKSFI